MTVARTLVAALLLSVVTLTGAAASRVAPTGAAASRAAPTGAAVSRAAAGPAHIVVVTLPGVSWEDIAGARTPVLHRLARDGAVAAMSARTATRGASAVRGYLTLGAGNRANAAHYRNPNRDDQRAHQVFGRADVFEGSPAAVAVERRTGVVPSGVMVSPWLPLLSTLATLPGVDTRLGALGDALAAGGLSTAVVLAADLTREPVRAAAMRRAAALVLVDSTGGVGQFASANLLRPAPSSPFGVETDPDAFEEAVRAALDRSRVVLAEPGETLRADEFAATATPTQSARQRRRALERADALVGRVVSSLGPDDALLVVSVSSETSASLERLVPAIAYGAGFGRGWLTSPTTRRNGIVTLPDIAPTVLERSGLGVPAEMAGTPARSVPSSSRDRIAALLELDRESAFRERFVPVVTGLFVALLVAVAVLAFIVFLAPARLEAALAACALAALAVAPATAALRALGASRFGVGGAVAALVAVTAALVTAAMGIPGPRRTAGAALLLVSAAVWTADLLAGAPLQMNGAFGYSPIIAGRFYGNGNLGFAVLFSAGTLGLLGIADARGARSLPRWTALALVALVAVIGLPQLGADFGGVLAAVPALLVGTAVARGSGLRLRRLVVAGASTAAAAVAVSLVDLARPVEQRTHLGRFASRVASGGVDELATVLVRKGRANVGLLDSTAWTWTVPLTIAVLALLVWRRPRLLRDVMAEHPLLKGALAATVVGCVLGFAFNDSGIAISGVILAHTAPFFVLVELEAPP